MDNIKLKKYIKSFATNIAFATMMITLALTYIPTIIQGQGSWALFVGDIICPIAEICFAADDWKKIKTMLAEPEKPDESAN